MKKYIIYQLSFAVLFLLAVATGCERDKVDPPLNNIPVGDVLTLKELKELSLPYTFDRDASVYVTVAMDESTGNIYKQLYVQDETDGFALVFDDGTTLKEGDSLRVYLNGMTVGKVNETYQIGTLSSVGNIVLLGKGKYIEPIEVTMEQINDFNTSKEYHLKLIKLVDVQFVEGELGSTWGDAVTQANTNRTLESCDGATVIVRTSGHATFAGEELPSGKGSLVAVLGVYNTTMQLWARSMEEVAMNRGRCGEEIVFSETFASGQGDFTIFDKTGAETTWAHSETQKAMEIKFANAANEDWLISPAINLTGVESAALIFDHAANNVYISGGVSQEWMKKNLKVVVSKNYNAGDPAAAEWTELTISDENLPSGSDWIYKEKVKLTIPETFTGIENVRIAFKYSCDETESATWRVKNIIVENSNL